MRNIHKSFLLNRSFKPQQVNIGEYKHGKRFGPEKKPAPEESFASDILFADQRFLYTMWVILRSHDTDYKIPSWTGFFINLSDNIPIRASNIGYLDCLDAPSTEMSTVYYMMERSLRIKDQLKLKSIVCVYDQAIYAKVRHC